MKRLITFLRLTLAPLRAELVAPPHPDMVALHARLDATDQRLDAVITRLKRGLASRSGSHLAVVKDSKP